MPTAPAATTGAVPDGFSNPSYLPGTTEILDRSCQHGVWCPIYLNCKGDFCNSWRLNSAYFSPETRCQPTLGHCTGSISRALRPPPSVPLPLASVYASAEYASADNSTLSDETDENVVEIVITAVVGGCGLILIAAGFYYRRHIVERIA